MDYLGIQLFGVDVARITLACCGVATACATLAKGIMPAKQYDAQLDEKSRITIQGTKFRNFVVTHDKNGNIILQPRSRSPKRLAVISARTLKMMDRAIANFRNGRVSKPISLNALASAD